MAELGDILENSFRKPLEDRSTLLKGTLLIMSTILIIPIFTLYGYFLNVLKASSEQKEIPEITDLTGLTIEGIKMFVVFIPLLIVNLLPVIPLALTNSDAVALAFILFYNLFALVIGYISLGMVMNYAVERDWRKLYTVETFRRMFTFDYLKYFAVFIVAYMLLYMGIAIVWLLSFITIIGWIVVIPLTIFYLMLWIAVYLGYVYNEL